MSVNDGLANRPEDTVCYVCDKAVGDHWFSRVLQGQNRICLCSPGCSILFAMAPVPPAERADRMRFYHEQDQQFRAAEAASGHVNSYDTTLAHEAY